MFKNNNFIQLSELLCHWLVNDVCTQLILITCTCTVQQAYCSCYSFPIIFTNKCLQHNLLVIPALCEVYKIRNSTKYVVNRHAVGVLFQGEMIKLASAPHLFCIKPSLYAISMKQLKVRELPPFTLLYLRKIILQTINKYFVGQIFMCSVLLT